MDVTKRSGLTGVTNTRDIDVEPEQIEAWENGMLINEAMPHVSKEDREFIMTGITPEEWDAEYAEATPRATD